MLSEKEKRTSGVRARRGIRTAVCLTVLMTVMFGIILLRGKNAGEETAEVQANTPADVQEPEEEEPEMGLDTAKLLYADRDYEGYNYRIADRASGDWMTFDVAAEELTGAGAEKLAHTPREIAEILCPGTEEED